MGSEQEAIALRAAGHIFIGWLVGKTTVKATIDPCQVGTVYQNQFVGRVWVDPWIYPDDLDVGHHLWNDIACGEVAFNLAGLVIESIRIGRVFDDVWEGIREGYIDHIGLASDWIDAWLTCYADWEYDELHTRFWVHGIYKHAEELLRQYWSLVHELAEALLERGTLTSADINPFFRGITERATGYPAA
jgi:hypothetical protein